MKHVVPIVKDAENELPIPTLWRPTITEIVDALVEKDYLLTRSIKGVSSVSKETAIQIKEYIEDYGEELVQLPDETWNSSVCLWTGTHWELLVDLWTKGGPSDLVLDVKILEHDCGHIVDIQMVCVP